VYLNELHSKKDTRIVISTGIAYILLPYTSDRVSILIIQLIVIPLSN